MHKIFLIFCLLAFSPLWVFSQTHITWHALSDVTFVDRYSEEGEGYYQFPKFSKDLSKLHGEEVLIKGYIIPLDPTTGVYVLSASTYANCFFCGASGPESIIELHLKPGHRKFKMDESVTMKGKLKLNTFNIYQCVYILEDAEVYKW